MMQLIAKSNVMHVVQYPEARKQGFRYSSTRINHVVKAGIQTSFLLHAQFVISSFYYTVIVIVSLLFSPSLPRISLTMSSRGQFNSKNPTIKRIRELPSRTPTHLFLLTDKCIVKEASELANNPSPDYHAEPLENDLFEWHFTLRGPPEPSPYADGIYHGRIQLPAAYPLRPPAFRFLTPTGRFEVNREICLSISGHHEESWQPAWGLRTALVAIRSFMDTNASGQLGGLESTEGARRKMAAESLTWKCPGCDKTNEGIMKERQEAARQQEDSSRRTTDEVPEELKLAYREDLNQQAPGQTTNTQPPQSPDPSKSLQSAPSAQETHSSPSQPFTPTPISIDSDQNHGRSTAVPVNARLTPTPTRTVAASAPTQTPRNARSSDTDWIDKAIWGVVAAIVLMVLRKFL